MDESVSPDALSTPAAVRWPTAAELTTLALAVVALLAAIGVLAGVVSGSGSDDEPARTLVVTGVTLCIGAAIAAGLLLIVVMEIAGRASWATVSALACLAATSALLVVSACLATALR